MEVGRILGKDWFRILADLERVGISNAEVARLLDVGRWKVSDWKSGIEPNYYYGDQLVTLHIKHCSFVASGLPLATNSAL